jgi:adenine-specific DNA methylase
MAIETQFDVPFVAGLALREKQIQQAYRPIIAVHKWFARRPGTLFRALLLSEFGNAPIRELFFRANELSGCKVADPFMGGGTTLIEANRLGCDVAGFDINPMSAWIVREEIEEVDLDAYREQSDLFLSQLRAEIASLYLTDCPIYGDTDVPVKYFLWVKVTDCEACGRTIDLFPGYLVAEDSRHTRNVLVCPQCGDLNEVESRKDPGRCRSCETALRIEGSARRGRCICQHCGHINAYPSVKGGPLAHRLFAIEYYNPVRKAGHAGRFFKKPDAQDLARLADARERYRELEPRFVPENEIPPGDETDRLRRWGYTLYGQLFNERQLLGLELSCRLISSMSDKRLRRALATNLSDLLRYQNMLCRYDTWALKSLDIFSVHGFPVGLVQCESNLLGIPNGNGVNVGSGGWTNIIEKYTAAKRYCAAPFEVRRNGSRSQRVAIKGEWIGIERGGRDRDVSIQCADAATLQLEPSSLDAVFTDPPYFANVQYGELMDFCYVWLRRLVGAETEGFEQHSTRNAEELTGNTTQSRDLGHFTEGLARVYSRMTEALKPGMPLAFTYHHNNLKAYFPVGVAILDAGLACTATLPCPAEMSGSVHIHGTGSSIVDTVFVCRKTMESAKALESPDEQATLATKDSLDSLLTHDLTQLTWADYKPTRGDARCIAFGHHIRVTVARLRADWDQSRPVEEKLARFAQAVSELPDPEQIVNRVTAAWTATVPTERLFEVDEIPGRKPHVIPV